MGTPSNIPPKAANICIGVPSYKGEPCTSCPNNGPGPTSFSNSVTCHSNIRDVLILSMENAAYVSPAVIMMPQIIANTVRFKLLKAKTPRS